ncbi:hypothetical protein QEL91_002248 [Pseudomonas putida]|nr:hypothetical protein [Pseudomonas putida]
MSDFNRSNDQDQNDWLAAESMSAQVVQDFLVSKGLNNLKCELCHRSDWIIPTGGGFKAVTVAQTVVTINGEGEILTAKKPFVFVFCAGCGNTKQMFAELVYARISPDEPANREFLAAVDASLSPSRETTRD